MITRSPCILSALCAFAWLTLIGAQAESPKPNFVIFISDDLSMLDSEPSGTTPAQHSKLILFLCD